MKITVKVSLIELASSLHDKTRLDSSLRPFLSKIKKAGRLDFIPIKPADAARAYGEFLSHPEKHLTIVFEWA